MAALKRAGEALSSDDLLDMSVGLALAEGWLPEQLADFSRRSIATRLRNLELAGLVRQDGAGMDTRARRTTPLYAPTGGYDAAAPLPPPPRLERDAELADTSCYDGMSRPQLLALLEAQDDIIESVGRFFNDLRGMRDKARARLQAVGLEAGS